MELAEVSNRSHLDKQEDGWSFDSNKNATHVKVKTQEAHSIFNVYVYKDVSD